MSPSINYSSVTVIEILNINKHKYIININLLLYLAVYNPTVSKVNLSVIGNTLNKERISTP